MSAITDVSVRNADTGKEYSTGDLAKDSDLKYMPDDDWDDAFAGTWYAVNVTCSPSVRYLPAGTVDDEQGGNAQGTNTQDEDAQGQGAQSQGAQGEGTQGGGLQGLGAQSEGTQNRSTQTGSIPSQGTKYMVPAKSQVRPANDGIDNNETCSNGRSGDTIEIGWNIPATYSAESMKFDIAMTFKDVVTLYHDVAYFKWEPVGDDNTIPIGNLHARVSLPKAQAKDGSSSDSSDSSGSASSVKLPQQWLHYSGNGNVTAPNAHTIDFTAENMRPHQHVDLVSISDAAAMKTVIHTGSGNHAQKVVAQEKMERLKAAVGQTAWVLWSIVTLLAVLAAIVYGIYEVIVTNRKTDYRDEVGYYRDIPDVPPTVAARLLQTVEGASGSRLMRFLGNSRFEKKLVSSQMAATMLSLADKKMIAIYPGESEWYEGLDFSSAGADEVAERFQGHSDFLGKTTETIVLLLLAYQQDAGTQVVNRWQRGSVEANRHVSLTRAESALLKLLKAFAEHDGGSRVFDLKDLR